MTSADLREPTRRIRTVTLRGRPGAGQISPGWPAGGPVFCTYCIRSQVPAAKTCRTCDASMCPEHLQVHTSSSEHDLCEPTDSLHDRKCPVHMEPLTHYCSEDASTVCHHCLVVGDHKGHAAETLLDASEKQKEKLENALRKRRLREERTRKRMERLQEQITDADIKGTAIADNMSSFFTDMREQLEALERQMVQEVRERRQKVTDSIRQQVQELEVKMETLSKQISYTEELCRTADPLEVMRGQKFDNSTACLAQEAARKISDEPDGQELDEVFVLVTLHRNLLRIVNKVRRGFYVPESSDLAFNAKTAGDFVFILGDGKTMCKSSPNAIRPENPEKFYCPQALSGRSFSIGRHAWEVEASGTGDWMIGVAYPSIERTGHLSYIGINDKSWCLQKSNGKYSVKHNFVESPVDAESTCRRFLVYLDYDAGQLSFYQLSNPISHLHTFRADFTEPLHAAFTVDDGAWVRIRT
ncbi:PREDICTED: tripartite motif-containing protein 16-like [Nanorana parkeri]|uniref:tripartite motif-containing protein 16-like n=1 Tax=Nanorana parkeri TaxID=125878 RepID=UPI0008549514|nr:PREDICTED: tripartite motif-containing protein 16-like [Nanorana parkeri]